jgi:hypothetical protein
LSLLLLCWHCRCLEQPWRLAHLQQALRRQVSSRVSYRLFNRPKIIWRWFCAY